MEETTKNFTPQESLEIISKFILNYKKNFKDNSFYFLLWGWVISLASISHFLILTALLNMKEYSKIGIFSTVNWVAFPLVGMIIEYFYIRRSAEHKATQSHIDRFLKILWLITALAIVMELLFCLKMGNFFPGPFILTVVGLSTLVTGVIIKFRPVIFGGIFFFVFAVIGSFFNNEYQLLINALAIIIGYLLPGYMLRAYKSE